MEKVYDYIVVGSGFGGSVDSLRFSEKGKRFNPDDVPKTNWNLRNYLCFAEKYGTDILAGGFPEKMDNRNKQMVQELHMSR